MTRTSLSAALLLALSACATAPREDEAPSAPREQTTRNTQMITTVDASGRTTVIPLTTTSFSGAREVEVLASADDVFRVLGEAYTDFGMTIGTIDPPNRTTGNANFSARGKLGRTDLSTYLDCGQTGLRGPAANVFPVRMSVLTMVIPDGDKSRVRTLVSGAYVAAETSGTVACTSTGELEGAIARAVQFRAARGR
jgi:hypothetical protein